MELVIISGKGGTGKTMITAALKALSGTCLIADCDVDAPNLSLYYKGRNLHTEDFYALSKAKVDESKCISCGICDAVCRFDAMKDHVVDEIGCEGCGACVIACPNDAITLIKLKDADIYTTKTDEGLLFRAKMASGSDGSGMLITKLRKNVRSQAKDGELIILDGSPGIGCPVISSITAADLALIVTEPTISGISDLKRVVGVARHFNIQTALCINKYDINLDLTEQIIEYALSEDIPVVGEIPFDETVIASINSLTPITSYPKSPAAAEIKNMWENLKELIESLKASG